MESAAELVSDREICPNRVTEVEAPERLEWTHDGDSDSPGSHSVDARDLVAASMAPSRAAGRR